MLKRIIAVIADIGTIVTFLYLLPHFNDWLMKSPLSASQKVAHLIDASILLSALLIAFVMLSGGFPKYPVLRLIALLFFISFYAIAWFAVVTYTNDAHWAGHAAELVLIVWLAASYSSLRRKYRAARKTISKIYNLKLLDS